MHIIICICIPELLWSEFFCILPLSQKFHEPEGFTVLGFKLFHEIPIYSVLSKLDDDEAHKVA